MRKRSNSANKHRREDDSNTAVTLIHRPNLRRWSPICICVQIAPGVDPGPSTSKHFPGLSGTVDYTGWSKLRTRGNKSLYMDSFVDYHADDCIEPHPKADLRVWH